MSEKVLNELENESGEEAGNKRGLSCVRAHKQNVVQSTANHWKKLTVFDKEDPNTKINSTVKRVVSASVRCYSKKNESKEDESLSEATGFI